MFNQLKNRTNIIFGVNQENEVGRQIKYLGSSKVLIVYGNDTKSQLNLLDKVRRSLRSSGLDYSELLQKYHNPRIDTIFDGIRVCKEQGVDFVLAIGGVAEFSCAKIIAVASKLDDNFYEMFKPEYDIEESLPIGIISTSLAGGIASVDYTSVAHKLDDNSLTFYQCQSQALTPKFVIFSPELCLSDAQMITKRELNLGVTSIVSGLLIRYFSKNKSQELACRLVEAALKNTMQMYRRLSERPNDLDSISNLIWASISTYSMDIFNLNESSAVDTLAKALISTFDCRYEEAFSVIIPAWFKYNLQKEPSKIAQLGNAIYNIMPNYTNLKQSAQLCISHLLDEFNNMEMPVTLSQLGGNAADISKILYKAGFPEKDKIGQNLLLDKVDCEVVLSLAL